LYICKNPKGFFPKGCLELNFNILEKFDFSSRDLLSQQTNSIPTEPMRGLGDFRLRWRKAFVIWI